MHEMTKQLLVLEIDSFAYEFVMETHVKHMNTE